MKSIRRRDEDTYQQNYIKWIATLQFSAGPAILKSSKRRGQAPPKIPGRIVLELRANRNLKRTPLNPRKTGCYSFTKYQIKSFHFESENICKVNCGKTLQIVPL